MDYQYNDYEVRGRGDKRGRSSGRVKGKQREKRRERPSCGSGRVLSVDVLGSYIFAGGVRQYVRQNPQAPQEVVVGDMIAYTEREGELFLHSIDKRKNTLSRRETFRGDRNGLGANLDYVFVLVSLASPPPRLGFADRVICAAEKNGITPVIVMTKRDAVERADCLQYDMETYQTLGYTVHYISTVEGTGIECLLDHLRGAVSLLCGQSGVGKTTLLNRLQPGLRREVGEVSESYHGGRHITTSSFMIELGKDTHIIDTPGIKTFRPADCGPRDIEQAFREFGPYRGSCRFKDCLHQEEPDCAVRQALSRGSISSRRYESYLSIVAEL